MFRNSFDDSDLEMCRYEKRDKKYRQNRKTSTRDILITKNVHNRKFFGDNLSNIDLSNSSIQNTTFESCNFSDAIFQGSKLERVAFINCEISKVNFDRSEIIACDFSRSYVAHSSFFATTIYFSDFKSSNLSRCRFKSSKILDCSFAGANLSGVSIINTILGNVDLSYARLVHAIVYDSELLSCRIFGSSVWKCDIKNTKQHNIIITPKSDVCVYVDDIESAQAIFMFLSNHKIRGLIDASAKNLCLVLGRFSLERMPILVKIKNRINELGRVGVIFDFEKPSSRNLTETITLLAHLANVVIVDISDPSSVPHELMATIPKLPSVRFVLIQDISSTSYAMVEDLHCYPWVENTFLYSSHDELIRYISKFLSHCDSTADSGLHKIN